jgi:hypothetical protein
VAAGPGDKATLSTSCEAGEPSSLTVSRSSPGEPGGSVQVPSQAPGSRERNAAVPRVTSTTGGSPRREAPCGATT